jgi:putative oxidoreductase
MIDAALLLLRSVTGGFLAGHGAQKLFGSFQGPGLEMTSGFLGQLGLKPPDVWARIAGATELTSGLLTAAGLLNPVGPISALGPLAVATTTVHWGKPIWVTQGGAELPVTDAAVFTAVAMAGPGRYSLDSLLGIRLPRWVAVAAVAGVTGGSIAAHLMRRTEPAQPIEPEVAREEREVELTATAERARDRERRAAEAQAGQGTA